MSYLDIRRRIRHEHRIKVIIFYFTVNQNEECDKNQNSIKELPHTHTLRLKDDLNLNKCCIFCIKHHLQTIKTKTAGHDMIMHFVPMCGDPRQLIKSQNKAIVLSCLWKPYEQQDGS